MYAKMVEGKMILAHKQKVHILWLLKGKHYMKANPHKSNDNI